MTLKAKLDAVSRDFEAGRLDYSVPAVGIDTMRRATTELIASGAAANALRAGQIAPAFKLSDADGQCVSSIELLARGPMVLSFYRGAWCPYCSLELQSLQEALPKFVELGASLVAISPQMEVNSRMSVRQNGFGFPILSDPHNDVAAAFGLRFALPDYLIEMYRGMEIDLPTFNGDPSWTLPMPARYVIARNGMVLYAEVNPDYTRRPEPEDMLPPLRRAANICLR